MEDNYYKPCPEYDRCCELIDRYWEKGDYETCFRGHLELAERGYPLAECQVGWFYLKGQGVRQDDEKAFYWTKRAAEHGDWDAQYNLGTFYEEGTALRATRSRREDGILPLPGRGRMRRSKNAAQWASGGSKAAGKTDNTAGTHPRRRGKNRRISI